RGQRPVRARRGQGRALGAWTQARPLFDARRARSRRLKSNDPRGVSPMSGTLVLVRHGQSEWNLKNLFTGWRDPGLTEQGHAEAKAAGAKLAERGFRFDIAYTSVLTRAQVTCDHILQAVGQPDLETIRD